jgi:acetyltransferase-like isoleucine patch superfamily enzyme
MNLGKLAGRIGPLPAGVGLPWAYFERRGCFLDCRGPLAIDKTSRWGLLVTVLTRSHDIEQGPGWLGPTVDYGVTVEAGAWIGSRATLAGCRIGAGAIVAAGSVVRGQTVGPGVMVAGNPARVVARWNGDKWSYLTLAECGFERMLA